MSWRWQIFSIAENASGEFLCLRFSSERPLTRSAIVSGVFARTLIRASGDSWVIVGFRLEGGTAFSTMVLHRSASCSCARSPVIRATKHFLQRDDLGFGFG